MRALYESSQFLLARWVLPVSGPAQENACLAIHESEIVEVISKEEFVALPERISAGKTRNYGEAIICPGLLNLHTHLDYSALKHLDNYSNFFSWIKTLIGNSWQWDSQKWFESALGGATEILSSGTSMVLDSSVSGAAAKAVAHSGLRGIVGLELFGIVEEEADEVFAGWLARYQKFIDEADLPVKNALATGRLKLTIAPHTPYSVCPALIAKSLDWSREHNLPLLIHVSESEAECRWIASHDDDLDKFLVSAFRRDLPALEWRGHGLSPVKHLDKHNLLHSNVVAAHLVQVDESDIECLAKHRVAAVHCPRSNSRLRNGIAPLQKLIKAGLKIGLGTDSAASTDDLDVLAEARFAWDLHRAIDKDFSETAEKALYYLTLGAAEALQINDNIGSLEPGKKADFAVFSTGHLAETARQRPYECLIYGGAKLNSLTVDGNELLKDGLISNSHELARV